jgi:hypothetical protein
MDAVEITCKIADKLGQSRHWENRISKGVYESGEFSDNEYAERTCALRTKIMEDGYASSFSVPVLEIVQMVLEIQEEHQSEENYKWQYRDGFSTPEEHSKKVEEFFKDPLWMRRFPED